MNGKEYVSSVVRHCGLCFAFFNSSRIEGRANFTTSLKVGIVLGLTLSSLALRPHVRPHKFARTYENYLALLRILVIRTLFPAQKSNA